MNKAELVFRGFFKNDAEYRDFLRENAVSLSSTGDSDSRSMIWRLDVRDQLNHIRSIDGKPATIIVNGQTRALVVSWIEGKLHRHGGPAYVDMDSDSCIVMEWWNFGRRIRRDVTELIEMTEDEQERELTSAFACIGMNRSVLAMLDAL
jgi:hypothetical protein